MVLVAVSSMLTNRWPILNKVSLKHTHTRKYRVLTDRLMKMCEHGWQGQSPEARWFLVTDPMSAGPFQNLPAGNDKDCLCVAHISFPKGKV